MSYIGGYLGLVAGAVHSSIIFDTMPIEPAMARRPGGVCATVCAKIFSECIVGGLVGYGLGWVVESAKWSFTHFSSCLSAEDGCDSKDWDQITFYSLPAIFLTGYALTRLARCVVNRPPIEYQRVEGEGEV
jgi:hypothetical protein